MRGRAKFPWRITAFFSWTNCPNSAGARWKHCASRFLSSRGIQPPPDFDSRFVRLSFREGVDLVNREYHLDITDHDLVNGVLDYAAGEYYHKVPAKPGVHVFLSALRDRGVRMYVATATYRSLMEPALRRTGLWDFFDGMLTVDEVGRSKQSPLIYEQALSALRTPKEKTPVFEDALHAAQTAIGAGFRVVGVIDEFEPRPEDLRAICDDYVADLSTLIPQL